MTLTHTLSALDDTYDGQTKTMTVTVADNDVPQLQFSKESVAVAEGGADGEYTVRLDLTPSADVTVALSSSDASTGASVSTANTDNNLTFSATSFSTPQTVTVSPQDDTDRDDTIVTVTHTASGPGAFEGLTGEVRVRVSDDEVAKLSVPENERVGEGATDSYGVVLTKAPAAAVTVTVTSGDTGALTVANSRGGNSLTFGTTDWSTAQRLTLAGVQDDDGGHETVTVTHALTGSSDYAGASEETEVRVVDDEPLGILLDAARIAVAEGGSDGKYAVSLSAQPTAAVTVRVTIGTDVVVGAQSYVPVASLSPEPADVPAGQLRHRADGDRDADGVRH